MIACVRRETQTLCRGWWGAKVRISPNKEHSLVKTQVAGLWCLRVTTAFRFYCTCVPCYILLPGYNFILAKVL